MPIQYFGHREEKDPWDALGKALNIASTVYGVKVNAEQLALAKEQHATERARTAVENTQKDTLYNQAQQDRAKLHDPNSNDAKLARADGAAYLDMLSQTELGKKNAGGLKPLRDLINDPTTDAATLQGAFEKSPLLKSINALAVKGEGSGLTAAIYENRRDLLRNQQDFRAHQGVLARLARDPQLSKRVANYQNLDNALSNITQADSLTPQQIQEFQQTVRNSLGIGGGGVGERQDTYIQSLGLNAANWRQFVTGDPAQMSKDSNLLAHFKNLATIEQKNIGRQLEKRLNAVTAGNGSMYQRRPDLKADLEDAVSAMKDQVTVPGGSDAAGGSLIESAQGGQESRNVPGTIVNVKGVKYRVGSDGDTLEPL